jgi:hypothetical protein
MLIIGVMFVDAVGAIAIVVVDINHSQFIDI